MKRVSFTACIRERKRPFLEKAVVDAFLEALELRTSQAACIVPVYCFMPDHLHVVIAGQTDGSRPKIAMDEFKRTTALWFAKNRPEFHWQKDYHDHIIRASEDWRRHVNYILRNPVRAGLVENPLEYPYMSTIGMEIADLIHDL